MTSTLVFAPFALSLAAGALAFGHISEGIASAKDRCMQVHAEVTLQASSEPGCMSAIGLCARGELTGSLAGRSSFVGTSSVSSVDTAATAVVLLTGDNRIETKRGVLFTKDAIVLRTTGQGEFAEVDQVVAGSGEWKGATGTLTATGTFLDGRGEGTLEGTICTP